MHFDFVEYIDSCTANRLCVCCFDVCDLVSTEMF